MEPLGVTESRCRRHLHRHRRQQQQPELVESDDDDDDDDVDDEESSHDNDDDPLQEPEPQRHDDGDDSDDNELDDEDDDDDESGDPRQRRQQQQQQEVRRDEDDDADADDEDDAEIVNEESGDNDDDDDDDDDTEQQERRRDGIDDIIIDEESDNDDDDDDDDDEDDEGGRHPRQPERQRQHVVVVDDDDDEWSDDDTTDNYDDECERTFRKLYRNTLLDDEEEFIRLLRHAPYHYDVNHVTYHHMGTILMIVCFVNRNMRMIQALLEYGADVNIIHPTEGYTALHLAVRIRTKEYRGHYNPDDPNEDQNNYRHPTIRYHRTMNIVPYLLQHGAHINIKTIGNNGLYPLHICAINDTCVEMLQLMLSQDGLEVNVKDDDGRTPLHLAVGASNVDAVPLLLAHPDTDITIKDHSGFTAVQMAAILYLNDSDDNFDSHRKHGEEDISIVMEKSKLVLSFMHDEYQQRNRHTIYSYLFHSHWIDQTQQQDYENDHNNHDNNNIVTKNRNDKRKYDTPPSTHTMTLRQRKKKDRSSIWT